ncbi:hypothetical protein CDAR_127501 [Caerostris darwini]|uniref:Uncharacterized protein n=1 Tax=Caerostris darwini TaxID=1538125 RepID=A0AAV4UVC4_9ARAC|nr:hypothetical protein CDAR_127501 [Caerostris darwini]
MFSDRRIHKYRLKLNHWREDRMILHPPIITQNSMTALLLPVIFRKYPKVQKGLFYEILTIFFNGIVFEEPLIQGRSTPSDDPGVSSAKQTIHKKTFFFLPCLQLKSFCFFFFL